MTQICIFLSTVSAEFRSYRDALRRDLDRPNVTVKIQEDFIATGTETLDKLDEYLQQCDAVIHLVGNMTGALAQTPSVAAIQNHYPDLTERFPPLRSCLENNTPLSYTQWEAWLALYHRKVLIIAVPEENVPRDERYQLIDDQYQQQTEHLTRLAAIERYPEIKFTSPDRLAVAILRSKLQDILAQAIAQKDVSNLPLASIGKLFKGRSTALDEIQRSLRPIPASDTPVVGLVISGLGGIGKTRLAIEYAWQHRNDYNARFFITANSVAALHRNLAALCKTLDLEEQQQADENKQRDAVLKWLCQNPGWLLIMDNADTEETAAAIEAMVPQLLGGHLLVTSRLTNWSGALSLIRVDVLSNDAATEFLLERTYAKRRRSPDDDAQARLLSETLGYLALALEQAAAYINQRTLTFKSYLEEWHNQRNHMLSWSNPRLMQYPESVAVTWLTTFDRLSEGALQLLQQLAWFSPAAIPESLLDVSIESDQNNDDRFAALAELEAYSLINRANDSASFTVHSLVQEVTRQHYDDLEHMHLMQALRWIDAAFVGDPSDVRSWAVLDPLQPHAQAIARYADSAGIAGPTSRLLNNLGGLYHTKALYAEAEPLFRRALAIDEASLDENHLTVAVNLNNLGTLFMDTNRLSEAEPLMRRALVIDEASLGQNHPDVALALNILARLLQDTNRLTEAEPLFRRALAINEASFGENHLTVAVNLNNLGTLLMDTNRLSEAEPLMRRALVTFITSLGSEHPNSQAVMLNYIALLTKLNKTKSEIQQSLADIFMQSGKSENEIQQFLTETFAKVQESFL